MYIYVLIYKNRPLKNIDPFVVRYYKNLVLNHKQNYGPAANFIKPEIVKNIINRNLREVGGGPR